MELMSEKDLGLIVDVVMDTVNEHLNLEQATSNELTIAIYEQLEMVLEENQSDINKMFDTMSEDMEKLSRAIELVKREMDR